MDQRRLVRQHLRQALAEFSQARNLTSSGYASEAAKLWPTNDLGTESALLIFPGYPREMASESEGGFAPGR